MASLYQINISEGGVRFRTNRFIPVQNRLLFRLNVPMKKPIEAIAQPAWIREIPNVNQFEIGAKFLTLTQEDKDIIQDFMSGNLT